MYADFVVKINQRILPILHYTSLLRSSRISNSSPETKLSVSARTPSRIMYFLSRRFHVTLVFPCSHAQARADAPRNCIRDYATRAYGTSLFALQIRDVLETR